MILDRCTTGERVPADMRILSARGLQVQEAALTGEAVAAIKKPGVVDDETALNIIEQAKLLMEKYENV